MPDSRHRFVWLGLICFCASVAIADEQATPQKSDAEKTAKKSDVVEYDLRYKFKRGEFLHYETESSSTLTVQVSQFKQVMKETRQTQKHLRVVAVDSKGRVVLEPVLDHAIMTAQANNRAPVVFDSDSKEVPPKDFAEVASIIGKAIVRVRYRTDGTIDEVLPVPGLEDKLSKDKSTHAFLVVFAGKPIAVGDSWNDDFDVLVSITRRLNKKLTIRRRYRLDRVQDGMAELSFRTYPLSLVKEPQLQAQLIHRSLSGRVKFDINEGKIIEWSSQGSGQVFNAVGPRSEMKSTSTSIERYVSKPRSRSVLKKPPIKQKPKQFGPVGPPLPPSKS
jgi:hypothetical protein